MNMPTAPMREMLGARARSVLSSLKKHDQKEIAIIVMDMLANYDVAATKQLTAAERKANATIYVRELHGVPTWAVYEACNRIRMGTAPDISHQFKPTPIQVRVLAVSIAQPFKEEVSKISALLGAKQLEVEIPAEERAKMGELLRGLATKLRTDYAEAEEARREKWRKENVPRIEAERDAAIMAEYAAHKEEPIRTLHGALISRSLAKLIETHKQEMIKQAQAEAQKKARAEKPEPDIPY